MAEIGDIFKLWQLPPGIGPIIMWGLIVLILLAPLIWYIWWKRTYKHIARVTDKREDRVLKYTIHFRYKVVNGITNIKFSRMKLFQERPPMEYIEGTGTRDIIYYERGNDGYFYPIKRTIKDVQGMKEIHEKVRNWDAEFWAVNRHKMLRMKWNSQSFMEKYGIMISFAIMCMIFIIGMWVFWNGVQGAVAPIGAAANNLAASNELMRQYLNQTLNHSAQAAGGIVVH